MIRRKLTLITNEQLDQMAQDLREIAQEPISVQLGDNQKYVIIYGSEFAVKRVGVVYSNNRGAKALNSIVWRIDIIIEFINYFKELE